MAPIADLTDISGDDVEVKRRQKSLDTVLKQISTSTNFDSVKSESTSSPFVKSLGGRSDTSTTKPEDELDSTTDPVKKTRRIKKRRNFSRRAKPFRTDSSTDMSETDEFLFYFSNKAARNQITLSSGTRCMSVNDSDTTPLCKTDSKSNKEYDLDEITTESELIPIGDHAKGKKSEKGAHCSPTRVLPKNNIMKDRDISEFLPSTKRKNRITQVNTTNETKESIALLDDECSVVEEEEFPQPPYTTKENAKSTVENSIFLNEQDLNSTVNSKCDTGSFPVREIQQRVNDYSKSIRNINFMQNRRDDHESKHFARKSLDYLSSSNRLLDTKDAETLTVRRSVPRLPKRERSKECREKTLAVITLRDDSLDKKKSTQIQELCRHSQQRVTGTKDAETLTSRRRRTRHLQGDEVFRDELSTIQPRIPVAIGNAGDGLDEKSTPHFPQKSPRNGDSVSVTYRRSPSRNLKKEGCDKSLKDSKNVLSKDFPHVRRGIDNRSENIADQISALSPRRSLSSKDKTNANSTLSISALKVSIEEENPNSFVDKSPKKDYFQEINENMEKCAEVQNIPQCKQKQPTHKDISIDNVLPDTQDTLKSPTYSRLDSKFLKHETHQGFRDESPKTKYFQEMPHGIENVVKDSDDMTVSRSRLRSLRSTQPSESKVVGLDGCESTRPKGSGTKVSREVDPCRRVSPDSKYFDAKSRVTERNVRENHEETHERKPFTWHYCEDSSPEELMERLDAALSTQTSISKLLDDLLVSDHQRQGNHHVQALSLSDVIATRFDVNAQSLQAPENPNRNLHSNNRPLEVVNFESDTTNRSVYTSTKDKSSTQNFYNSEIPFVKVATHNYDMRNVTDENIIPNSQQKRHRHSPSNKKSTGNSDPEYHSANMPVTIPVKRECSGQSLETVLSKNKQSNAAASEVPNATKVCNEEKNGPRRKPLRSSSDKKLLNIFGPENITDKSDPRNPLDLEELSPNKESYRVKTACQPPKKFHTNQSLDQGVTDVTETDRSPFNSSWIKDSEIPQGVKEFISKNYETSSFLEQTSPDSTIHDWGNPKKSRKSNDMHYLDVINSDTIALRRSVRDLLIDAESIHSIKEFILRSKSSQENEFTSDQALVYVSDENLDLPPRKSDRNYRCSNVSDAYLNKYRRSTPCLLKEGESRNNGKKYTCKSKNSLETSGTGKVSGGKIAIERSRKGKCSASRMTMDVAETRAATHMRSAPRLLKEGDSRQTFKELATKTKHFYETPPCVKQTSEGANDKRTRPSEARRTRRIKPSEMGESIPTSRRSIHESRHSIKEFTSRSNNIHDCSVVRQPSPVVVEGCREKTVRSGSKKPHRNKQPETIILDASDFNGVMLRKSIPCILIEGDTRRNVKAYFTRTKSTRLQSPSAEWSAEVRGLGEKATRLHTRRPRRNRASDHGLIDMYSDTGTLRKASSRLCRDVAADYRHGVRETSSKTKALHEILPANQRDENVQSPRRKSRINTRSIPVDNRFSDVSANRSRSIPRLTKERKSIAKAESCKSRNLRNTKDEEGVVQSLQKSRKRSSHADLQKRVEAAASSGTGNRNKSFSIVMDILQSVLSNTSNVVPNDEDVEDKMHRKSPGTKQPTAVDAIDSPSRQSKEAERGRSVRDESCALLHVEHVEVAIDKNSRRSLRKSRGGKTTSSSDDPFSDYNVSGL